MAVINYTPIPLERTAEDEQLPAVVGQVAVDNMVNAGSMRSGGGFAFDNQFDPLAPTVPPTSVVRAWSIPGEWVTIGSILLWSVGGTKVQCVINAESFGDDTDVRINSGPFVTVVSGGSALYTLTSDGTYRTGWIVVEIQISSRGTGVIDTGTVSTHDAGSDIVQLPGPPGPFPCAIGFGAPVRRVCLAVQDLGGNQFRIHPAERESLAGVAFAQAGVSRLDLYSAYAWVESPTRILTRPQSGDRIARATALGLSIESQRAFISSRRCAPAGRLGGLRTLAGDFGRWGLSFIGTGSAQIVEEWLIDEPETDTLEAGILWGCSQIDALIRWEIVDDTGAVVASTTTGRIAAAYTYPDEAAASLASWRLLRPQADGDWVDVGEPSRAIAGDRTTGMTWTPLRAAGVGWRALQSVRLRLITNPGTRVYVWGVACAPLRVMTTAASFPLDSRIDSPAADILRLSDYGFRQIRRDFVYHTPSRLTSALAGVHRTSPIPGSGAIGWGVETVAADTSIVVEVLDSSSVLVDSITLVHPAGSRTRRRVERDPVLDGDATYIYRAEAVSPGGTPDWDALRIYEIPIPEPVEDLVLTFGDAAAEYLTYNDLPDTVPEGSLARHWTEGTLYRLWKAGAVPVWVPASIYGVDGSGLALTAWITGTEAANADLNAQGWPTITVSGDANAAVVYEGATVLLKCSGTSLTTNVSGLTSVTLTADTAGWSGTTRYWVYADSVVVSAVNGGQSRWLRGRDGTRNFAVGSNAAGATTYFDWADNLKNGQANQVSFTAVANLVSSTRRQHEFLWAGTGNPGRNLLSTGYAPQGGISYAIMTADANALAFTVRAQAGNNTRTNLRIHRYFLVTW